MNRKIRDPKVKTAAAIQAAGGRKVDLTRALGLSRQATVNWKEYLPPLRARQIVELFPELAEYDE